MPSANILSNDNGLDTFPKIQNQGKEATLTTPIQVVVLASSVHKGKERSILERKK